MGNITLPMPCLMLVRDSAEAGQLEASLAKFEESGGLRGAGNAVAFFAADQVCIVPEDKTARIRDVYAFKHKHGNITFHNATSAGVDVAVGGTTYLIRYGVDDSLRKVSVLGD